MPFLVDTNVWLEVLLQQSRAADAAAFLKRASPGDVLITDFALHSIGLKLLYRARHNDFRLFIEDTVQRGVQVVTVTPADLVALPALAGELSLDFDDAYQYMAAEYHNAILVSFDAHFDATPRGRRSPGGALTS